MVANSNPLMCPADSKECDCDHGAEALRLDCSGKTLTKLPIFADSEEVYLPTTPHLKNKT